jgi:hypothetical protein
MAAAPGDGVQASASRPTNRYACEAGAHPALNRPIADSRISLWP